MSWALATDTAIPHAELSLPELESVYDALADVLDRAPDGKRELLLVKLVLLQAQASGDPVRFVRMAETALRDL